MNELNEEEYKILPAPTPSERKVNMKYLINGEIRIWCNEWLCKHSQRKERCMICRSLPKLQNRWDEIICKIDIEQKQVVKEFNNITHAVEEHPHVKGFKKNLKRCLKNERKTTEKFGWVFKSNLNDIGIDGFLIKVKPKSRSKVTEDLLINKFPQLVQEWDLEKNTDIDLNSVTYGSGLKVWWKCRKCGRGFETSICNRTNKSKGTGCKECYLQSIRQLDKDVLEEHRKSYTQTSNCVKIGDSTELYVQQILNDTKIFIDVKRIGNESNDNTDIVVYLQNGSKKSIQVKTITRYKRCIEQYAMGLGAKYPPDMLMCMINKERTRFALAWYKCISDKKSLFINFNKFEEDGHVYKFKDQENFSRKLVELIPFSVDYTMKLYKTQRLEYEMLSRLALYCKENDLSYRRNTTNGDDVDIYINNVPMQAKYRSSKKATGTCYTIHTANCCGTRNGIRVSRPYSDTASFEYFVVELGCSHNSFCFIPKLELLERGILSTPEQKGKQSVSIYPKDTKPNHWTNAFWNNIDWDYVKVFGTFTLWDIYLLDKEMARAIKEEEEEQEVDNIYKN